MAESLTELLDQLQAALVPPTRHAAQLPAASDLAFERSLSRKLAKNLDSEQARVLDLASRVLEWAAPRTAAGAAQDFDSDLIREGVYGPITERIEPLLERADDAIEKHLGTGKHRANAVGAVGAKSAQEMESRDAQRNKVERRLPARLLHDASLEKPQKKFTVRTRVAIPSVDDAGDSGVPLWKPILRNKVNALAGGDVEKGWLATEQYEPKSSYTQTTATVPPAYTRYLHPYAAELAALAPPAHFLSKPPQPASRPPAAESFAKTPFEWVGDAETLDKMISEIRQVGEEGLKDLAIDLEHHDYRSWSGITCLMQVRPIQSARPGPNFVPRADLFSRTAEYPQEGLRHRRSRPERSRRSRGAERVLDRPRMGQGAPGLRVQAENGANARARGQVFHGANSDIVWLQRDFGLYIVGLFDTYHATKVLGASGLVSL